MKLNCRKGKEHCLIPAKDAYPITKNGKVNCGRVKNAAARGRQQGVLKQLKKNRLCHWEKFCKVKKSSVC